MIHEGLLSAAEALTLAGLGTTILVAGIGAYSVLAAARKQADAALQAAQEQARASQDLAVLQVEAALASSGRQQWISTLRAELSELVGELYVLQALAEPGVTRDSEAMLDHGKRFVALMARVNLLLKDDVPSQRDLMLVLADFVGRIGNKDPLDYSMVNVILRLGQQIIRDEEALIASITERSHHSPQGAMTPHGSFPRGAA